MKKKKSWIFVIYAILIISAIIAVIAFWPKQDDTDKDAGEDVYATSFLVNLPEQINMMVGTKARLLSGYTQVQPSSMKNNISTEIAPKYNGSNYGLEFVDSTLIANEVGSYNLTFSVPKTESTKFSKTILITIFDENSDAHIIQKQTELIKGVVYSIEEVFVVRENVAYSVIANNKVGFSNQQLKATAVGATDVTFSFKEGYIEYLYMFNFQIKEEPIYAIILNNVVNNEIYIDLDLKPVFYINYEVQNREEGFVDQIINVTSDNESVIFVEDISSPFIKICALNPGTATLKLTYTRDNSVELSILVVVE